MVKMNVTNENLMKEIYCRIIPVVGCVINVCYLMKMSLCGLHMMVRINIENLLRLTLRNKRTGSKSKRFVEVPLQSKIIMVHFQGNRK